MARSRTRKPAHCSQCAPTRDLVPVKTRWSLSCVVTTLLARWQYEGECHNFPFRGRPRGGCQVLDGTHGRPLLDPDPALFLLLLCDFDRKVQGA